MIDVLFHCLNFGMLLAVGYYFFKKYAFPALRQQIILEKLQHTTLYKRSLEVKKQREHFENGYQLQEEVCRDLSAKMEQWRNAVHQRGVEISTKREILEEVICRRRAQQFIDYQIRDLQMRAIPEALAQSRLQLQKVFASQEKREHYMASVLNYMRKAVS